jgi:hypothetical protein
MSALGHERPIYDGRAMSPLLRKRPNALVGMAPNLLPKVEAGFERIGSDHCARIGEIHDPVHTGLMARPLRPAVAVRIAGLADQRVNGINLGSRFMATCKGSSSLGAVG